MRTLVAQGVATDERRPCEGCQVVMDWATYQTHKCPVMEGTAYLNPLERKLANAKWVVPKGTLRARGSVVN